MPLFKVNMTSTRVSDWVVQADSEEDAYGASIYAIRERGICVSDGEHDPEVAYSDEITQGQAESLLQGKAMPTQTVSA